MLSSTSGQARDPLPQGNHSADTLSLADTPVTPGPRLMTKGLALVALIYVALGFVVYANSLTGTALLHHVSGTVEDPILDNTMLHSRLLWPKIFTSEFLLATRGEYRPLGYALFAPFNLLMPRGAVIPWHVVMLVLQMAAAFAVFLMLRSLIAERAAAIFGAIYLANPLFAPLVNDVNNICFLWGMLFAAISLWLYLTYLWDSDARDLAVSALAFAAAAFTFSYAMLLPALMIILWLFHEVHPRTAAAVMILSVVAVLVARLCRVEPWLIMAVANGLALAVALAVRKGRRGFAQLIRSLAPVMVAAASYFVIAHMVKTPSIFVLGRERLTLPTELWFIYLTDLLSSRALLAALIMLALSPLVLLLKGNLRYAPLVFLACFGAITAAAWNPNYSDDVRYWEDFNARRSGSPMIELNLASAYLDAGKTDAARDLLMYLRYESKTALTAEEPTAKGASTTYDAETRDLLQLAVLHKLGRAYSDMGNMKVAGFYMFPKTLAAPTRLRKYRLMDVGDFCLKTGYISWAECHYACTQVMDPYDVRVYNDLGLCMLYKNYFRAAARHFRHVLDVDPGNPTALYYLSFITKVGDDTAGFDHYSDGWRRATGVKTDVDFKPVYDAFRFDRENMRNWFTGDPLELLKFIGDKETYTVDYKGKTYEFSEVPVEIGRYFLRRKNLDKASDFLQAALKANPKSTDALRELIDVSKLQNKGEDVKRFQTLLEAAAK